MPDLKLATTDVSAIKLGTTAVSKILLGTTEIWPGVVTCVDVLAEPFDNLARWTINTASPPTIVPGRTGTAVASTGYVGDFTIPIASRSEYVTVGFAFKTSHLLSVTPMVVFRTAGNDENQLALNADGSIFFNRSASQIGAASAAGVITAVNVWHYIEVQFRNAVSPDGWVKVRVNGVEVINSTGLASRQNGISDSMRVSSGGGITHTYDDLYLSTGIGCAFQGDHPIGVNYALFEDFDSITDWTNTGFTARTGVTGLGIATVGSTNTLTYALGTNESDILAVGFWFKCDQVTSQIMRIYSDAGATEHGRLATSAGNLTFARGSGGVIWTGTDTLVAGTWYFIELRLKLHDTLGELRVAIDGVVKTDQTGIDTKQGGTKTVYDTVQLRGAGSGQNPRWDDLYILTGAAATTLLGPQHFGFTNVVLDEPFNNLTSWAIVNTGGGLPAITSSGRNGNALNMGGAGNEIRFTIPAGQEHYFVVVGFALYQTANFGTSDFLWFRSDAGATEHSRLRVGSTGGLTMLRAGATTIASAPAGTLVLNAWQYVEVLYLLHDTGGMVVLRVNGVIVGGSTLGDIDSRNAGTKTTIDTIGLQGIGSASTCRYDDLYIRTGSLATFLGDHAVP